MLLTTITILGAVALLSFLFGTVTALYSAWAVTQPFNQLNLVKEQLTQEKLKRISQSKAVSCFVPYGSLDLLGCDSITSLEMGTSCLRPLTVLFVCLRSFEEVSSYLSPQESVVYLNAWLAGVVPEVTSHGGIIDKLLGDTVLVFFEKPHQAMEAALGMFKHVQLHNNTDDAEPMRLHIGMNTGDVVLGTIGTESRMETTTVGDAVNVASRMASLSHMYQTPFLCSHSTRTHLKKKSGVRFRALGPARVKGRPHPVNVCEVLDVQSEEQQTLKSASDDIFQEAATAFADEEFGEAQRLLKLVLRHNPDDGPALFMKQWVEKGPIKFVK
uniref:Guanylate cyclase domain-containing protein n=1 Tax=Eutreptiella gymnastica TaxID=73025 RepID=A0A7S4D0Q9_9EUGL